MPINQDFLSHSSGKSGFKEVLRLPLVMGLHLFHQVKNEKRIIRLPATVKLITDTTGALEMDTCGF
ncbi:MAG: hypothetical protein AAGI38_05660 [Bacteroidota bacterium]